MERAIARKNPYYEGLTANPESNATGGEGTHLDHAAVEPCLRVVPREFKEFRQSKVKHKRLTVYLPIDLIESLRNAVYWTPDLTLAGLIKEALTESLERREKAHGGPFPRRLLPLKGGRPKRGRPN